MKKAGFLSKLKAEGKLGIVEPSEEMKESYLRKADNCLKAAKILFQNELYENSVTDSYYAMYNSLLALLYKLGIKSENHSASIVLFRRLFRSAELSGIISFAKKERIDKQYYVESEQEYKVTRESCRGLAAKAEDFVLEMKLLIGRINAEGVKKARVEFLALFRNE